MPPPLQRLLDLDAGRLPRLTVRLDGADIALRDPEALPLADALRLGELLRTLADEATPPDRFDAVAADVVALVAPQLAAHSRRSAGIARRVVAFYAEHLARAAEALAEHGATPPFSTPPPPPPTSPASLPVSAAASGSN